MAENQSASLAEMAADRERLTKLIADLVGKNEAVRDAAIQEISDFGRSGYDAVLSAFRDAVKGSKKVRLRFILWACPGILLITGISMFLENRFGISRTSLLNPSSWFVVALLLLWHSCTRNSTARRQFLLNALTSFDDPRSVGTLVDLRFGDLMSGQKNVQNALLKALPNVSDAKESDLTPSRLRMLAVSLNENDPEWTMAALVALEKAGGGESYDYVRRVRGKAEQANRPDVFDAATRAGDAIETRMKANRESAKLLRSSEAPNEPALLVPAAYHDNTPDELLVRPVVND